MTMILVILGCCFVLGVVAAFDRMGRAGADTNARKHGVIIVNGVSVPVSLPSDDARQSDGSDGANQ